jgi:hypothetical protein
MRPGKEVPEFHLALFDALQDLRSVLRCRGPQYVGTISASIPDCAGRGFHIQVYLSMKARADQPQGTWSSARARLRERQDLIICSTQEDATLTRLQALHQRQITPSGRDSSGWISRQTEASATDQPFENSTFIISECSRTSSVNTNSTSSPEVNNMGARPS